MKKQYLACKICKRLTTDQFCPVHGDEKTTEEWFGFVIVNDPEGSVIAKRAGITEPGMYAIKVRS
ncbi:transcription elongation factor subunit Spt4 [Picrophilus oshimae]|uniref:Transcription elongation factor Spt4 n=1 Tax=Picrophilus torridus (strain ATCC 700027 / DSM 9790 / JCM 10055 / NBRC 100828 / KAW 2/3) TaxID=1122961 RepID=Q6L0Q0_PICTO|nr:transcription elongation factor subunit Spt4 [Picrophilus oshimae]AAT43452.1 DNA-directed RNA polymerase subunit E [Picrophilus oshimae DSM 9789]SMD30239.1 DNA-directed RNA polymerase, subunit E'' [Picrophilus oshimae DSM 9789]